MRIDRIHLDKKCAGQWSYTQLCTRLHVKSRLSEGSRRGHMYTAAGGKKIANEGEKDITMVTGSNSVVQTNWQTVDITRPLSSVRRIYLQAQGGVIYNMEIG